MIYYIKINDSEPIEFTVALEAKEYINQNFKSGKVFLGHSETPEEHPEELFYVEFEENNDVREAIDFLASPVE